MRYETFMASTPTSIFSMTHTHQLWGSHWVATHHCHHQLPPPSTTGGRVAAAAAASLPTTQQQANSLIELHVKTWLRIYNVYTHNIYFICIRSCIRLFLGLLYLLYYLVVGHFFVWLVGCWCTMVDHLWRVTNVCDQQQQVPPTDDDIKQQRPMQTLPPNEQPTADSINMSTFCGKFVELWPH